MSPKVLAALGLLSLGACAPHPVEPATSAVALRDGGGSVFDDAAAARSWYLRARVAEARGDLAEADRAMGWMVRQGRGFVTTWQEVGDYRQRVGRVDDAVAAYFEALSIDPDHGPTHRGLGEAWLALGRLEEVASHLDQAAAAGEDVVALRARLAWRRGEADQARHLLRQALWPATPLEQLTRAELAATFGDQELVERLAAPLQSHPGLGERAAALLERAAP